MTNAEYEAYAKAAAAKGEPVYPRDRGTAPKYFGQQYAGSSLKRKNNIPLFQHNPELIDADLCVIVDRKDYMIAKFHYMGDDAWKPDAKPDSFELVGVNNSCDMLEYDHTRLVMAAYVCHLTGFEEIDKALGGLYEMTMNKKKEL